MLTHLNKCLDTSDIVIMETYILIKALGLNLSGKVRKNGNCFKFSPCLRGS